MGIGKITSKILKLSYDQAAIHTLHTAFGNIVFLGFPLLDRLFPGGEAILYAALYQLVLNTVLWTLGVSMLDQENQAKGFRNLKKLVNPNSIALIIGLVIMLSGLKIPELVMKPLAGLGQTTIYLAMENFFISTIFSLFTLPLILFLLDIIKF